MKIEKTDWLKVQMELQDYINDNAEELSDIQFFQDLILYKTPKADVYDAFCLAEAKWILLLGLAIKDEEYEIAGLLKDIINIEKENIRRKAGGQHEAIEDQKCYSTEFDKGKAFKGRRTIVPEVFNDI